MGLFAVSGRRTLLCSLAEAAIIVQSAGKARAEAVSRSTVNSTLRLFVISGIRHGREGDS